MERRYYRQNIRALRLREALRLRPGLAGLIAWLVIKAGMVPHRGGPMLLPETFAEIGADRGELSPATLEALDPKIAAMTEAGFWLASYIKASGHLDPNALEAGGCWLIHQRPGTYAFIGYVKVRGTAIQGSLTTHPITETTCLLAYRPLRSGKILAATNERFFLDPPRGTTKWRVETNNPSELFDAIESRWQAHHLDDPPIVLRNLEEMARFADERAINTLESQVARGLMVPLGEAEVAMARAAYEAAIQAQA